ncbi:NIC-domain-containing protein [Jaminaea rosea]|uniref:NIC-domain-containing protein n=1 Tax=Jaminaea rosea TaxID=1569628 RepID=A0A316UXB8_9BASI|nr:NIC-domain-containing protein [Jaminaea rosea]PWN27775.1 NIC-domain-containing protein [Jaminaea rosea]
MLSSSQYGGSASRSGGSAPTLSDLVSQSRKLTSAIERERHSALGASGSNNAASSGAGGGIGGAELPSINLALDQLESQSRSLAAGGGASVGGRAQQGDAKAHYFLASAGIDAFSLSQNVNQTNIASAFEPLEPLQDTDVQGYLQHEQQQIILSAIDEGRRETLDDFNRSLARTMHSRWSKQKKRIFEDLGQHQSSGGMAAASSADSAFRPIAGRGAARTGSEGTSTDPPLSSLSMHTKLMSFDNLIRSLNQARLRDSTFPLASEFLRLAQQQQQHQASQASASGSSAESSSQLVECWTALQKILGEEGSHTVRERQFSAAYSDPATYYGTAEGRDMRQRITRGARRFLEGQFEVHVDNVIASNPSKAQLGGQPGIVARVAAFLRVSHLGREGRWASELEVLRKSANAAPQPVWASVFHLLRTGHLQQALAHAEEYEEGMRRSDAGFLGWFREWVESGGTGLSRSSRDRFYAEFNARFRNLAMGGSSGGDAAGVDPYKLALYRLIGRVDATRKFPSSLTKSTENWLWLQLMMIREPNVSPVAGLGEDEEDGVDQRDDYTLDYLARKLRSYGEKHFDPKGRRPLHYFLVLLLSGEFERAVAFLYARVQHQSDAVHFAIALAYYGLLRLPPAGQQQQQLGRSLMGAGAGGDALQIDNSSGREVAALDFPRLITRYIRLFSSSDARSALEYLYLICLPVSSSPSDQSGVSRAIQEEQRTRCYSAIKDLVTSTRLYADLVGDVRVDGARVPGAIEEALPLLRMEGDQQYLRNIVQAAAQQSEGQGRTRDAILLFNLAEEYDRVVGVLNRELGISLFSDSQDAQPQQASALNPNATLSTTSDLPTLAQAVLQSYESQPHILRRVDATARQTCKLLLELHRAVNLVRSGNEDKLEQALSVLEATDLFPLSGAARGDVVALSRRAEGFFRRVDESVGRNLSELLLLTMDVLYRVHARLKRARENGAAGAGQAEGAEAREARMGEVRNQARALMMFAGMLRFRIEQGVFAQLTRLDAFIR